MGRAIGMLETYGLLPAIVGLDAALKAANVSVRSFCYVSGGLVAWIVEGDVGSARVAVSAGKAAASRVGEVTSDHIIARAAQSVAELLPSVGRPGGRKGGTGIHRREYPARRTKTDSQEAFDANGTVEAPIGPDGRDGPILYSREGLEAIGIYGVRAIARRTDGIALSRVEIRGAKKSVLIDGILEAQAKAGR